MDLIYFVPGIMGSTLVDKASRVIWSLDYEQLADALGTMPRVLRRDLKAGSVIGAATTRLIWGSRQTDVYGGLLDFLTAQFSSARIIPFAYDWRKSNEVSGSHLAHRIQSDCRIHAPIERIFLIAHSMGGLVSLLAIDKLRFQPEIKKIAKMITIGTPFLGSAKSFRTLHEGLPRIHWLLDEWFAKLRKRHQKAAAELTDALYSFQSLYELLPPENHKVLRRAGQAVCALDVNCWRMPAKELLKRANTVHRRLQRVTAPELFTIYCNRLRTESGYGLNEKYEIIDAQYDHGDQTVTFLSAQGPTADDNRFPVDSKIPHGFLPGHRETHERLLELLN